MAKYVFPAIFVKEKNGYSVKFPDLESCYTQGDNLQDAYDMASDVLCLCLYHMEEKGEPIPAPSNPESIKVDNGFVALVGADTLEYRKFYNNKAVKKTLSIPEWLNTLAEREGINFSQILQEALKEKLNVDRP
ncbi:type II toxin-antitoxin system HicB family antitoxin [Thermoanaerobacterium sp. DL9XJH110]|uniref:type II toxin-antitoxin system HicB family antitoxin n=1 Tax=Thermoanaerobacterium sp. DL9XJH110 TaxID=3386643 RepID=UPI003BB57D6F